MLLYQINIIAQQFFQILSRRNVVHQLWWHGHKQVNITPFMMLVSGHRAEQQQKRERNSSAWDLMISTYSCLVLMFTSVCFCKCTIYFWCSKCFCKKSGFMRIEEACFDTEGKKKGERVRRKWRFPSFCLLMSCRMLTFVPQKGWESHLWYRSESYVWYRWESHPFWGT